MTPTEPPAPPPGETPGNLPPAEPPAALPPGVPPPAGGYAPQPAGASANNGKAVAALILGIVGTVLSLPLCCGFLGFIFGPIALVLGRSAQNEIRASGGTQSGESMAKAGFWLGIVCLALAVIYIPIIIFFALMRVRYGPTFYYNTTP